MIPRCQRKCLLLYVQIRRFHRHCLTLTIKSSMFHSLATRNECDAFSSGQFSRSAKDPISPFFFCWQGLRAGIRAILGTVAQCRKSASNPFLALWHFKLKAFLIAHFSRYWPIIGKYILIVHSKLIMYILTWTNKFTSIYLQWSLIMSMHLYNVHGIVYFSEISCDRIDLSGAVS